jgi:tyrosyl-tRNA synthetase
LLTKCGLIPSRKEGRRLIQQGGVSIDGEKVQDPFAKVTKDMFSENGYVVIKKGKKVFHKAVLK